MEKQKRKVTIQKSAVIIVNTGNFENVQVSQSIQSEVEYDGLDELKKKDGNMTQVLAMLLKSSAERTLKETNRQRVIGNEFVELW